MWWETANFSTLVGRLIDIIDILVLLVFALTLVVMLWQIINAWIIHGGDSTKVEEGKKTVFFGIIVLVVMSSIWGIVALLQTLLA